VLSPFIGFSQALPLSNPLKLESAQDKVHDCIISEQESGTYNILTSGKDPWIFTGPLETLLPKENSVLSFEYFCPKGLDHLQIYFCPPLNPEHSKLIRRIGLSEGWVEFAVDLASIKGEWGKAGDFLRLDFGNLPDVNIQVRNLKLRARTAREKELAAGYEEKKKKEAILEKNLREYLHKEFKSGITLVNAGSSKITISGNAENSPNLLLCEVPPWQDATEEKTFVWEAPVKAGSFKVTVSRFETTNGITRDRLLSKWVLARKNTDGRELVSHARYASQMESLNNLPDEKPTSRKGLGGFSTARGHIEDLDSLDITSATVNIWITRFMYSRPAPDRIPHSYNGKTWYFGKKAVDQHDSTFRTTARRNIIAAAILLIDKT